MRILFITQLFDPENSIKGLEFSKRLVALGHEVEIVTAFPSYPGGKIYPGYRQRWRQVEEVGGVRLVRLPTFISHGKSAAKRLLSYASFGCMAGIYSLFRLWRYDVIYAYYPPVMVGLAAALVGLLRRVPFIYDVQDLWPEALVATGNLVQGGRMYRFIDSLCNIVYRRATRIVVLSEGYRKALAKKGVPETKIERIYNWCDESRIQSKNTKRAALVDPSLFNVVYAGNLGAAQALAYVVDAAALIRKSGNANIRFLFVGTGVEEEALKRKCSELSLGNVQFVPKVPVEEVGSFLAAADVLLVHLADEPVFEITIPQKTQAYLMAGRPILMAIMGEAGDIIRKAGAGLVVQACQPNSLADAVIQLSRMTQNQLDQMASQGASFYWERMSMDSGVKAVDRLIRSVMNSK